MKTLTAKMNTKKGEITLTATEAEFKTIKTAVKFMNEMKKWASKTTWQKVSETRKYAQACNKADKLNSKLEKIQAWGTYCEGFSLNPEIKAGNFFA